MALVRSTLVWSWAPDSAKPKFEMATESQTTTVPPEIRKYRSLGEQMGGLTRQPSEGFTEKGFKGGSAEAKVLKKQPALVPKAGHTGSNDLVVDAKSKGPSDKGAAETLPSAPAPKLEKYQSIVELCGELQRRSSTGVAEKRDKL